MDIQGKIDKLILKKERLEDRLNLLLQQKSIGLNEENSDEVLKIDIQIAGLQCDIEKIEIKLLELEFS